ncbi:MAG: spermidine synthase [Pseudomonadota bacterium]
MPPTIEELDYQQTRLGELILRRRRVLSLGGAEVYEVKLGDEYLMSSLFHVAEVALADIALRMLAGDGWDVVVGGLGLGYTAAAALKYAEVARLVVVEALAPVIDWHRRALVPNGQILSGDPRCVFHPADFFACARGDGFDPAAAAARFDAILLDIDHTPGHRLHTSHGVFYTIDGLRRLSAFLKPGGVFALWSNDPPDAAFLDVMSEVFADADGHAITFDNPLLQNTATNGVYVGRCPVSIQV